MADTLTRFAGRRAPVVTPLLAAGLFAACGGKTLAVREGVGFETDSGADEDSGAPTDTGTLSCVEVQVTAPADLLCETDLDCASVTTGYLCRDELTCNCGGTAANRTAAARIASETAWIKFGDCSCHILGTPRCEAGQCTICGLPGPEIPPCSDAGGPPDSGPPPVDSGVPVTD